MILKEKLGVLVSSSKTNWEVLVVKFFDEGKWLFFGFIFTFLCVVPLGLHRSDFSVALQCRVRDGF